MSGPPRSARPSLPQRHQRTDRTRSHSPIPTVTEGILTAAGFTDVGFTAVHEPVFYGQDGATAFDAVYHGLKFKDLINELDDAAAEDARTRLRATLDGHSTGDGVYFDSRAWIVTARRRN